MQFATDDEERGKLRGIRRLSPTACGHGASDHGTGRWSWRAGERLAIQTNAAGGTTSQTDRAGHPVIARGRVQGTNDRQLVREPGNLREEFAES